MNVHLIIKPDGQILDCFSSREIAEKSIELSICKLSEEKKNEVRNELTILPMFVKDRVDHI